MKLFLVIIVNTIAVLIIDCIHVLKIVQRKISTPADTTCALGKIPVATLVRKS